MSIPLVLRTASPAEADVAGRPMVLHYGDVAAEYASLRTGAMLVDRSARGRVRIEGPKRSEILTGLVTNDVNALAPGHGQYAAALTPKGKVVSDLRIYAKADHLLVDTPPRSSLRWREMLRKYVNPRIAPHRDVSDELRDIGVFGPRARRLISAVSGVDSEVLGALPAYSHLPGHTISGGEITIARVPDLEIEGFEIFVDPAHFDELWDGLVSEGACPGGLMAWEIARIEAGRPEWGIEMDDTTIAQEANLDELHAISYTKGCYVGQEVVARVHFRGHVNKLLRGLLCGQNEPLPEKAILVDDQGKTVGDVRSSALSPRLGSIALGMVRREVEPGTTLKVQGDGAEGRADVTRLPFPL
ncbi:MAG: aminomethyl transferase family protein [Anaerolineae bacterium]|nr:aminomethyl transferase family protein [Gemmatimonadaceae bacterium]